jgi:hypothetical protein
MDSPVTIDSSSDDLPSTISPSTGTFLPRPETQQSSGRALPSRRGTRLALVGQFLVIAKLEEHDVRAPIFGVARVATIQRYI